jgi:hypothetical protein
MPRDTNGYDFGEGGEPDPLGGLLADVRPSVQPISSERKQQIFRDALRQSGVAPKISVLRGMRLWLAISLPTGALAGAAVLAVLAPQSPVAGTHIKTPDKYVHTGNPNFDSDPRPAPRYIAKAKLISAPSAINQPHTVHKELVARVAKQPNMRRIARKVSNRPALTPARLEFVQNDMLVRSIAAEPAAEALYILQDGQQPVQSDTVLQQYDTNNSAQVQPVRFVVHVSQGNESGFAKASSAILDDTGQLQRKYCTVKDDKETQNVVATTMIGDQSSGDGRLALTVSFTLDRPGKGETKQ